MRTVAGKVYLVGAGPGLVDMLTVRAHELICTASCLLHDDLVGEEVLALARPDAIVRHVGKRCGPKTITQEDINHWMIEYARAGHSVVRLKSGDPLLFGRAVEEIGALRAAGVEFEIVPGICDTKCGPIFRKRNLQNVFFAFLTHEIRNPSASVTFTGFPRRIFAANCAVRDRLAVGKQSPFRFNSQRKTDQFTVIMLPSKMHAQHTFCLSERKCIINLQCDDVLFMFHCEFG